MHEGYLKLTVLKILSKKQCSGYDLMREIEQHLGKKPSSGSIYPLLKALEKKKFILSKSKERKIVYQLTQQGKSSLKNFLSHRQDLFDKVERTHKYFEHLCGKKQPTLKLIFQRIVQGKAPFGLLTSDAIHFRDTLFRATNQELTARQKDQLKGLLQHTSKEIERICRKS